MRSLWVRSSVRAFTLAVTALVGGVSGCSSLASEPNSPRVLSGRPDDIRLQPLKDLDGYFPFQPPQSVQIWEQRSAQLRQRLQIFSGLWPMPTRTPLQAVIHGKRAMGDYTIEKVYFQTAPGFFTTGNLYRPVARQAADGSAAPKRPGVLCPHGHWAEGRFHDAGEAAAQREIQQHAEQEIAAARSPLQARCVQLARMGCVVFHYDMLGYADSRQISLEVAHRFAKQRPEMNAAEHWGLYSPPSESHLQHVMGLQTYQSIRALDFLESLSDVDPQRLAVTGASGGGTQTFMVAALDPRPAVAFPAVMVSTAMQGGCTCENACGLRVETGNVEIAALFAPKPLGMTAANDWTKEMETKGFPQLQQHYRLLGAPDDVMLSAHTEFGHNYNLVSRLAMYGWFNRHLRLGQTEPIQERPFQRLTASELTVWDSDHPAPAGGEPFERQLLAWWHEDAQQQIKAAMPVDDLSLAEFRRIVGGGVAAVIGRTLPAADEVEFEQTLKQDRQTHIEIGGLLRNRPRREAIPTLFLYPQPWEGTVVIWLSEQGKQGLFTSDGALRTSVAALLAQGVAVVGADLLLQGEFLEDPSQVVLHTRHVANPREFAGYTFGYNHTLFAQRVHDVLTLTTFVRNHERKPRTVCLIAMDGTGPVAAAARAVAGPAIDRAAIHTHGFRFGTVDDLQSPSFLPGGAKYGDLPGMLALAAPAALWLAGEGPHAPELVQSAYGAAGGPLPHVADAADEQAALEWLSR